jgi:hypothetical protein
MRLVFGKQKDGEETVDGVRDEIDQGVRFCL